MTTTTPILRGDALREIEQSCSQAQPPLMERAGRAAAELALRLYTSISGPPLIFAGPGNNGGDALVVARRLRAAGLNPEVIFRADPGHLPADAKNACQAWRESGGSLSDHVAPGHYGLVIDGLFGIGLGRAIQGDYAGWIGRINAYQGPVLALDCPSGLDALGGRALGPTVKASHTISFIAMKPGLLMQDGPDHCGEITIADLALADAVRAAPHGKVVGTSLFAGQLKPRPRNSHKGSFGSAGIIGGAAGMAGAALLAGSAALKLGAGRVYVGMLDRIPVDPCQPELMLREARDVPQLATALAVGPGLGQDAAGLTAVAAAIEGPLPLVLDADALNLLAAHPVVARRLTRRDRPAILTPHPAEAARLLEQTTENVQNDRIAAATEIARRFKSIVVLKGCGTVVVTADGRWFINTTGNPGLASAGSGDVLTGFLAALLAQGWNEDMATLAAVHLHGAAADACVAQGQGPIGLTAGELIASARTILNRWSAAG